MILRETSLIIKYNISSTPSINQDVRSVSFRGFILLFVASCSSLTTVFSDPQKSVHADAVYKSIQFHARGDTIPPRVSFTPLRNQARVLWPATVRLQATDNTGIQSATVEYLRLRDSLTGVFTLSLISDSTYEAKFPLDTSRVVVGDSIFYRITVRDNALPQNSVILPASGYYRFMSSEANILLVNDNVATSPAVSSADLIYRALKSVGYLIDTTRFGNIDASTLSTYDVIIMSAGTNLTPFPSSSLRQSIVDYVVAGGRILVEGGQVGYLYRKQGPFESESNFRRLALHDSSWVNNALASNLVFTQPANPIFTTPNRLIAPIAFITRTPLADRDAMRPNISDGGSRQIGGWSEYPDLCSIIFYSPPEQFAPTTIFLSFALTSIIDTTEAKRLVQNAVNSFFKNSASVTGIDEAIESQPTQYSLAQNFPNPFNPSSRIGYQLPTASRVQVSVYDILGREIARLVDEVQNAGNKSVEWNATGYSSGIYFYRMHATSVTTPASRFDQIRKMLIVK